jgi:hypothetical protein
MFVERINDVDSVRLVTKLQTFVHWWAPEWFPPMTQAERLPNLPPALEWAVRFPPDFVSFGAFIAKIAETGELQCFHSYGEQCDGFLTDQSDNPVVRFETDDQSFAPTRLNDFVVGTIFMWCASHYYDDQPIELPSDEIGLGANMIWDAPFVDGRVRAWLSGEELLIESPGHGTTVRRRPTPSDAGSVDR